MSVDIGSVVLIAAACFIAGVAVTLIAAAFLATPPMDGPSSEPASTFRRDP